MFNTNKYNRSNQQLVAHCFFTKGEVKYENYDKFYEDEQIKDIIERDNDY